MTQNLNDYMAKISSKDKIKQDKCSQCQRKDARRYQISQNEVRWLCPVHYVLFTHVEKEKPHFIKAKDIYLQE